MFCLYRALFFAITLLACVVIAAPIVEVEPQHVLGTVNQELLQAVSAGGISPQDVQQTSIGARVLTTASELFSKITKESSSSSNQPIHFRRRVRVVRRRHP